MDDKLTRPKKTYDWLLWLLLFTSTDTFLFGTNANHSLLYVPRIIGFLFSLYAFCMYARHIDRKCFSILLFLCCWASISCFISHTNIQTMLSRIIAMITGFSIILYYGRKRFCVVFDNFMFFISLVAVVTETVAYIMPWLLRTFPKIVNTAGTVFHTFFIGGIAAKNLNNVFIRCNAIFWEPGAFAIYLCLAILLQMFAFEKVNYKRLAIYVICLVFTFSTTGFVGAIALGIVFLFSPRNKIQSKQIKSICAFFLTAILAFLIFFQDSPLYKILFGKILENSSGANTRYASFFYGLRIAFDNPIFGIGGRNVGENILDYIRYSQFKSGGAMLTNTFTFYLAAFGLPFGIMMMLGTYLCIKKIADNRIVGIGLFLTIVLLYCGEMFFSFLPFAIAFAGFFNEKRVAQ